MSWKLQYHQAQARRKLRCPDFGRVCRALGDSMGQNCWWIFDKCHKHIHNLLKLSSVYLIFDRYQQGSIKESTREGWGYCIELFDLHNDSYRKSILTSTYNKRQLINLIVKDLDSRPMDIQNNKPVVTGDDHVPRKINRGVIIERQDMQTEHEEADNIIIQQASWIQVENILVRCNDADVFVR